MAYPAKMERNAPPIEVYVERRILRGQSKPQPWQVLQPAMDDSPPAVLFESDSQAGALDWAFKHEYAITHIQTINENWIVHIDGGKHGLSSEDEA